MHVQNSVAVASVLEQAWLHEFELVPCSQCLWPFIWAEIRVYGGKEGGSVGRMNKVVVNKVVNIGLWVVLIGSVYFISIGVVTGTFGAEQPEDGVLVVVAILIASTLFTEHQKKTSGDKERDKN